MKFMVLYGLQMCPILRSVKQAGVPPKSPIVEKSAWQWICDFFKSLCCCFGATLKDRDIQPNLELAQGLKIVEFSAAPLAKPIKVHHHFDRDRKDFFDAYRPLIETFLAGKDDDGEPRDPLDKYDFSQTDVEQIKAEAERRLLARCPTIQSMRASGLKPVEINQKLGHDSYWNIRYVGGPTLLQQWSEDPERTEDIGALLESVCQGYQAALSQVAREYDRTGQILSK